MAPIDIRPLRPADLDVVPQAFAAAGWPGKRIELYRDYLRQQESGLRRILVATLDNTFAGYLTVCWASSYPPFRTAGIPEIQDFNVLPESRRHGVGSALMDAAEAAIAARASPPPSLPPPAGPPSAQPPSPALTAPPAPPQPAVPATATRPATSRSAVAGIGVGLYAAYGAAQRLYARRGYVPDGRGVVYRNVAVEPGASVTVDDDLVLMMTRRLPDAARPAGRRPASM